MAKNTKNATKALAEALKLTMCEVQLYQEHYPDYDEIEQIIKKHKMVKKYAFALHDKDIYLVDNPSNGAKAGDVKKAHYHIYLYFGTSFNCLNIVKWFHDCKNQFIQPIKSKTYYGALPYLIHATAGAADKYQYDPSVVRYGGVEIEKDPSTGADIEVAFDARKYLVVQKVKNPPLGVAVNGYIAACGSGDIRAHNIEAKVPVLVWARYKNQLLNACSYFINNRLAEMQKNPDSVSVLFFTGKTGTGKTSFAKHFCIKNNLSFYVSGASNDPLENYKGQDVLILDDVRDSTFLYTDLLKMLDPHTRSGSKSRYTNKTFIGHTIIVTSEPSLENWYRMRGQRDNDGLQQLKRRVEYVYHFTKETITVRRREYSEEEGYTHQVVNSFVNPIKNFFPKAVNNASSPILDFLKETSTVLELAPEELSLDDASNSAEVVPAENPGSTAAKTDEYEIPF